MTFQNRADAGRQLAAAVRNHAVDPIVVGLSRGGVPVAAEVARLLGAPLEICVARPLIAPGNVAIGAIAEHGAMYFDVDRLTHLSPPASTIDAVIRREAAEVERLAALLRDDPPLSMRGRNVILVDDGIVTGHAIRAAARSLHAQLPRRIELAVPVGNTAVIDSLRGEVDRVTCLVSDPTLVAVGARYRDFWPVSDAEVTTLLAVARRPATELHVVH